MKLEVATRRARLVKAGLVKVGLVGIGVAGACAALAGCVLAPASPCLADGDRKTAEIVFARVSAEGVMVSESDFTHFLDEEVSPRFPDGLTIIDAQGRWTKPAGTRIHEPSKMVMIVLSGRADDPERLGAIRAAYQRRYHQPSVLLTSGPACVSL